MNKRIEAICQEIERRRHDYGKRMLQPDGMVARAKFDELTGLLAFIDSMPEESCKDSLQVPETCKGNAESFTSLKEAAEKYADKHGFRVPYDGSNNYYDDVDVKASKEGFLAGAEWAMHYQEKKIADAYEKGKQEGIRVVRSWESSPGQCGY